MGYATTADLYNVSPPVAFGSLTPTQQQAALDAMSAEADTILKSNPAVLAAYPLPTPYDPTLVRMVCLMARLELYQLRGYNPNSDGDTTIADGAQLARSWLQKVQRGEATLSNVAPPLSAQSTGAGPIVLSQPQQGWIPVCGSGVD